MLTITEDLIMSGIAYSRDVFVSEKSKENDRYTHVMQDAIQ